MDEVRKAINNAKKVIEEMQNVPSLYEETLQVWGIKEQIHKFSEELGELLVAMHHWYDEKATKEELADEIADVEIVCGQLRYLVGFKLVDKIKEDKLRRLRGRVDSVKKASSY
jgi:NTP pyrophosphatase (non-canonical NTP hydrolase)